MKKFILIFVVLMLGIFISFFALKAEASYQELAVLHTQKITIERQVSEKEKKIKLLEKENKQITLELEEIAKKKKLEQERIAKEKKEAILRAKRNITPYTYGHKIFSDKKYAPIHISKSYREYFSTAEVVKGDNYWTVLERVFGKKQWSQISSKQKNIYVSYAEKISRVGRYHLRKGMKLVLPNNKKSLAFSPVEASLSADKLVEINRKRNAKVAQYWTDFGSSYGNSVFQSRANKNWSHALIINRKTQYFGMYKNGVLQNWGPISSGKVGNGTPSGFYVSLWYKDMWHSKTYGDAEMPNAVNYDPDGFFTHAGVLPGYPQSHGCPRVLTRDSEKIFSVAENEVFPILVL